MRIITLDFETYFDNEYTLSKMTTEAYVRDPRFEAHGAAVCGSVGLWFRPDQLRNAIARWKAEQAAGEKIIMLAHHAHFDGLILNCHFDFRPDIWLDTLSMARVVFDSGVKNGLGDIAGRLGLRPKSVPYDKFKGKHWHELDPQTQQEVATGAVHDCALTRQAFDIMMAGGHPAVPYPFPPSELPVIDLTVKMFTEPVLVGNIEKLGTAWMAERDARRDLFARLGQLMGVEITPELLRKDAVFAAMLEHLGVEPEFKLTPKGNEKHAFAKSDYFMQDLVTSEDPDVALLAEARLKAQSSIYMTRIERYGDMALRGPMCVYLAYAAAHTRRWGGGDKTNFQNLPRPDKLRPNKAALRRAIEAP